MAATYLLRLPSTYSTSPISSYVGDFPLPSMDQISGSWYITRTSVPFWKDKRNATITFSPAESTHATKILNNITTYQTLSSNTTKSIHGTDRPSQSSAGHFEWRGHGWLRIASSRWEILGYGELEDGGAWLLIFTQASIFTSEGVILYSRNKGGLSDAFQEDLEAALAKYEPQHLKDVANAMFEVKSD